MDPSYLAVDGWEAVYNDPAIWHFRSTGPTPEALVEGRERLLRALLEQLRCRQTRSIPEATEKAYARPTPVLDACTPAGLLRFIPTGGQDSRNSPNQADHAVLSIGGDKSLGNALAQHMKLVLRM